MKITDYVLKLLCIALLYKYIVTMENCFFSTSLVYLQIKFIFFSNKLSFFSVLQVYKPDDVMSWDGLNDFLKFIFQTLFKSTDLFILSAIDVKQLNFKENIIK